MKNKILLKSLAGLCALAAVACGGGPGPQGSVAVYLDESQPIEKRVEDALSRMTLEEKVAILHAQSKFSSAGVPRLGIPEVWCTDGPHGIRPEVLWDEWDQAGWTNDSCTAFPALTCLAATWNPEMSALYGKSIGEEARYREKDILLGPGVNIYRTPLNGRNFEYMGEDPYLSSRMVVPYIEEVQKNGVAACVKHFALNNQEAHRHGIDVEVDDRALNEIYLPAFKAAVQEGGAWAVMGAYNKYKGEHCCHNQYLLNDILKRDWAFDGVVISDWGGVHDTREAIFKGLDMEFGTWTDGLNVRQSAVSAEGTPKTVAIERETLENLPERLGDALADGGCAGVVVNTVRRAQEIAARLRAALPGMRVLVFHSQFVMADRARREQELLRLVGKDSAPAERERLVVVGAQVIEQSLDLDFDLLATDLCPMDLLLQRIGRLHRHEPRARPEKLRLAKYPHHIRVS